MNHRITVRDELEKELDLQGHSLSHFSKISGINRGILSATLNGNPPKPISIKQLDQMTHALGKEEGWLYEQFMNECFEDGKANWRRVRSLLVRCVELELTDIIELSLYRLLENLTYIKYVFDFAEELYNSGNVQNLLPFYKCVATHERDFHSERLAISQYRIFRFSMSNDLENNFRLSMTFAPFRNYLPDYMLLDALLILANISYTMHDWKVVKQYADELIYLTNIVYKRENFKRNNQKNYKPLNTERPLVVYYAKSHLFNFIVLHKECNYKEAEKYIEHFADLSWFEGLDEAGLLEVERFKIYGLANKYTIKMLLGEKEYLNNYINFMNKYPDEQLVTLYIIFKSSNLHNWNVDYLLNEYDLVLYPPDIMTVVFSDSYYIDVRLSQYINLYYEIALYQCNKGTYDDKLEKILFALESTVTKYNKSRILDCLELFKKLRLISKNGN